MSSMSLIAPSITMPVAPMTIAELEASSPQTATGAPPTSTTTTSPFFTWSMASTGFAQSPLVVWTVSARPTIFCLCFRYGCNPRIIPCLWNASEMLHVDTLENASNSSSSPYFFARSVSTFTPDMDFFKASAEALISVALVIPPPTMIMDAPASTY